MPEPLPAFCLERLWGAALGTLCGDALGAPVEGMSPADISAQYGGVTQMLSGRLPAGSYTDDSQMMIAILETLAGLGKLEPAALAQAFARIFDPQRGYGRRIAGVMERIKAGVPWSRCGTDSYGNGGAMRVGVLGAYFPDEPEALAQAALEQCSITHTHTQALAMATAQAMAVGLACKLGGEGKRPDPRVVCDGLARMVEDIDGDCAARLAGLPAHLQGGIPEVKSALIWEYGCDVRAIEAVPPALACFLATDSARQAVELAVSLGNDTDTMAAMTGALAGAYYGASAWPAEWVKALENKEQGRDYVYGLCQRALNAKIS
jgi:poly(ADP-ribose) glycohydrolase ARH3